MKTALTICLILTSILSSFEASALQCVSLISADKKPLNTTRFENSEHVLKTYLMVNLAYPQSPVGLVYAVIGMLLSGKASYEDIDRYLFNPSQEKLREMYIAMKNSHKAHGVDAEVPFRKIVQLTEDLQGLSSFTLLSTFSALFPKFTPTPGSEISVIKEFLALIESPTDPQAIRVRAYGDLILAALKDKDALAFSKVYRKNFNSNANLPPEEIITVNQMGAYLKSLVQKRLEQEFPETRETTGPMYDGKHRPLSQAIGTLLEL